MLPLLVNADNHNTPGPVAEQLARDSRDQKQPTAPRLVVTLVGRRSGRWMAAYGATSVRQDQVAASMDFEDHPKELCTTDMTIHSAEDLDIAYCSAMH